MLIIFDCDGVLIDSEILSAQVDAGILKEFGYEITPEALAHRFAGITTDGIFERIGAEIGREFPDDLMARVKRETDDKLRKEVQPIDGVHAMLDAFDDPRCICSNSRSERLRISLGKVGLWDRFRPYVYSAQEVGTKQEKPAPDIFLYAAEQFETAPGDAIVVEDSVTGVTGAVAAGMRVIGFTGASHSWPGHADALTEAGAITVVHRLAAVPPTIEALREWRPSAV
jgi:HAD superfamily hydrolase (TIGR01509 family)